MHWGEDEVEVRIYFAKRAASSIRKRQWHPSQSIEKEADGSLTLILSVNQHLESKRLPLASGDAALGSRRRN